MNISVRVFATREQVLRGTTLRLDVPAPATVADVLRQLVQRDRSLVGLALDEAPALSVRPGFALLVNGVNALHSLQGLDAAVGEGDTLALIHGITGG